MYKYSSFSPYRKGRGFETCVKGERPYLNLVVLDEEDSPERTNRSIVPERGKRFEVIMNDTHKG